jgi:molybdopterin molybdotransferase
MRTVEEHRAGILNAVRPLSAHSRAASDAEGLTLHDDVHAVVDIPAFDNSAMDGFAVRFDDVSRATATQPVDLRVIGDLPAGSADDPPIRPGEGVRIMTGAPLPTDADTVVPFESTRGGLADSLSTASIVVPPRNRGAHVRCAGEDVRAGGLLIAAGTRLGAFQLAAIAAAGVATVVVSRRPRVGVVATGSELVAAGTPLRRGQIPESNSTLLAGMTRAADAEVIGLETVDDEGPALQSAIARLVDRADAADAIIFSGGVSAGAFEVVRNELAESMAFTSVAMQPGKPQGFGVLPGGTLLFGLPGNPVSAAVSFEAFVRPALLALQGRTALDRPRLWLPAATSWRSPAGRRQYLPAVLDQDSDAQWRVSPATEGGSGSHLAGGLGQAHAFAVVHADVEWVEAGDLIEVIPLEGWGA